MEFWNFKYLKNWILCISWILRDGIFKSLRFFGKIEAIEKFQLLETFKILEIQIFEILDQYLRFENFWMH